jgi:hypothetical protein
MREFCDLHMIFTDALEDIAVAIDHDYAMFSLE